MLIGDAYLAQLVMCPAADMALPHMPTEHTITDDPQSPGFLLAHCLWCKASVESTVVLADDHFEEGWTKLLKNRYWLAPPPGHVIDEEP